MKKSYVWIASVFVLVACQQANEQKATSDSAIPQQLNQEITQSALKNRNASVELKAQLSAIFKPLRLKVPVMGLILANDKATQKYQREFAALDQDGKSTLTRMRQTCLPKTMQDKHDATMNTTFSLVPVSGGRCELDFLERAQTLKNIDSKKFDIQSGTAKSQVETTFKVLSPHLVSGTPFLGYKQIATITSTFENYLERERALVQGSLHQVTKAEGALELRDNQQVKYSSVMESITRVGEEQRQVVTTFHFNEGDLTVALIRENTQEKAFLDGIEISPEILFRDYGVTFSK